jgi:hypothetical protein
VAVAAPAPAAPASPAPPLANTPPAAQPAAPAPAAATSSPPAPSGSGAPPGPAAIQGTPPAVVVPPAGLIAADVTASGIAPHSPAATIPPSAPAPAPTPAPAPARAAATAPAPHFPPPARPSKLPTVILAITCGLLVVAIGLSAFLLIVVLGGTEQRTAGTKQDPTAPKPAIAASTETAEAMPAPVPSTAPAAQTVPSEASPAPAAATTAAAPPPESARADSSSSPAPAVSLPSPSTVTTTVATPPPPRRVNRIDPRVQAWIQKVRLSGIRTGPQSKALLNDRVYLVGDIVSNELNLRLSGINSRTLEFEDAAGNTYELAF